MEWRGDMVELITVEADKCTRCGACSEICPMRVIGLDSSGLPAARQTAYKLCINCGYCVDVCAWGALKHRVRRRSSSSAPALRRLRKIRDNRRKRALYEK